MKSLHIKRESDGTIFEIKKNSSGMWEILKHEPYYITEARLGTNLVLMWNGIDPFPSMIQAYKFLKQNINDLI